MKYKYEDFNDFDLEDMKNFLESKVKLKEIVDDGTLEEIKEYLSEQNNDYDGQEGGCINDECNLLMERAVDLLNNYQSKTAVCPLCRNDEMEHEEYKGTHIYVCEPCPAICFECVDKKDYENMIEWLKQRGNINTNDSRELMKEEIKDYINARENMSYIKLSKKEINKLADNIVDKILMDNDLNETLDSVLEFYITDELYSKE